MRLQDLAQRLGAQLRAQADPDLTGVAAFNTATASDVVFIEDPKYLSVALASRAAAIIVAASAIELIDRLAPSRPLLLVADPRLAFAKAAEVLHYNVAPLASIHPSAVIDPSASLGQGVSVGANAFIGPNVVIADGCRIGPGCVLISDIDLGQGSELVARVTIYPRTTIGRHAVIHAGAVLGGDGFGFVRDAASGAYFKFPQIGSLIIGNDVEIGANTTVDRGALGATTIGNGVKLDNLVHLAHNVSVGDNVVIAAQTGVSGSSVIDKDCIVAGQVGIGDHVHIEEGAILGAQCGVPTKKVIRGKGVVFWGTPARPIAEYLRELAAMARLARRKKGKE